MENIQLSLFGRMCPERSIVIKDTIFYKCSGKSQRPIFQCLNVENGQKAEWFNAGGVQVAWRQLDAQYWGVPQRRKRIFLVASFGYSCAEQILFKPESVPWNIAQSRKTKERTSNRTKGSTNFYCYDARGNGGETAPTMTDNHNGQINDYCAVAVYGFNGQNSITAAGVEAREELSPAITRNKQANVLYAAGFIDRASAESYGIGYEKEKAPNGSGINKDKSFTLNTVDKHAVVYALDRASFNQGVNAKMDFSITNDEINSPLVASGPSAVAYEFKRWIVRRLTPTECERLQGFPDRWTEIPKIESLSDNEYAFWLGVYKRDKLIRNKKYKKPNKQQLIKWYNKLDCDGNRYKMLGNSLAIPCVFYILNNIAEERRKNEKHL